MKPIIIDMKDMTDSSEVYDSKANPWLSYFIYIVLGILIIGFLWAYFFKIDIVVKGNGILKINNQSSIVSTDIEGRIDLLKISDGDHVKKGDVLLKINSSQIEDSLEELKEQLVETSQRVEMLKAYDEFLSGNTTSFDNKENNPYYGEFISRRKLIDLNNQNLEDNIDERASSAKAELANINNQISQVNNQINRIDTAISSIGNNKNSVSKSDHYYFTLVETYLVNHKIVKDRYDRQIDELNEEKNNLNLILEEKENNLEDISLRNTEIDAKISQLLEDKNMELSSLKTQQIMTLNQEKNSINNSKNTLESNKNMLESQVAILKESNSENSAKINIETEKQNVSKELLSYEEKKKELKSRTEQYETQNGKTSILATKDGYISFLSELKEGSYISQGQGIFNILPDIFEDYEVEVLVENSDIGKVNENQTIKFEIPAYPSREYGFITSKITSISKETKVDENTGKSYYIVKSIIEEDNVDKRIKLNNEMFSQARIIVDEKRVLTYLLEKINLWD
ncbi:MAG: HlyD family efflux transporter periplasmic adaptor subunit [Lagierella massiliensis]|nr:HlyD family efflux transporter periplasmic adaptor subunit [Lagierella massiliensis]